MLQIAERFGVPSLGELMAKGKLPSGKLTLNVRAGADNDHEVEISPEGEQSVQDHICCLALACKQACGALDDHEAKISFERGLQPCLGPAPASDCCSCSAGWHVSMPCSFGHMCSGSLLTRLRALGVDFPAQGLNPITHLLINKCTCAGIISWRDKLYSSLSAFALAAIHLHNPNRQSCNGWDEVRYDGQPLVRSDKA